MHRRQIHESFIARTFTLLAGSTVAQLIPLVSLPILARFFDAADFGELAVYSASVVILSVCATGRLEHAVIVEQDPKRASLLELKCAGLTVIVSSFVAAVCALGWMLGLLPLGGSSAQLGLLPLGVFAAAGLQVAAAGAIRRDRMRELATSRVVQAASTALFSLCLAAFYADGTSLVLASLVGQGLGLIYLLTRTMIDLPTGAQVMDALALPLGRHRRFALFTLPADLLGTATAQLPLLFLGAHYGSSAAGTFLVAQRLLLIPLTMIGSAVMEVYKVSANRLYREVGTCRHLTLQVAASMAAIAVLPVTTLGLAAQQIFDVLLGPGWLLSAQMCQLLAIPALLRLVATPISYNFYIAGRQREDLVAQIFNLIGCVAAFVGATFGKWNLLSCVAAYALNMLLVYLYYTVRSVTLATARA